MTDLKGKGEFCFSETLDSASCFPRGLVSLPSPRDLVSFDPRHVKRSPPIGERIWVGRYDLCLLPQKELHSYSTPPTCDLLPTFFEIKYKYFHFFLKEIWRPYLPWASGCQLCFISVPRISTSITHPVAITDWTVIKPTWETPTDSLILRYVWIC